MPHSFNANWIIATADAAKAPAYFVRIEGLDDRQYSTAPVRGATRTTFVLLEVPDSVGQRIDQIRGKSSLSLTKLRIVDRDSDFTNVIATERPAAPVATMVNRRIDLYSGYMTLLEGNYERIVRGQITQISMKGDGQTYEVKLVDLKRHEFDDVFTEADATSLVRVNTTISVQVQAGTQSFEVIDVGGVDVEDFLFVGPNVSGEEEKIEVKEIQGLTVRPIQPLAFTHQVGTRVRWATTVIEGNPINILYAIQTGDFASADFPLVEALGLPTGLGIDPLDIATADLINERDNFYADEVWRFEVKRPSSGIRFLESKIYRFLGYPYTAADGRLSFRMYRPPYPDDAADLDLLTRDEINSWTWERAVKLHVNRVKLGLDLNAETGRPGSVRTFERPEDEDDQLASKEVVILEEEDTGLRIELRGSRLSEERANVLLRRFNPEPVQLRISCDLRSRAIEVGQVLVITHPEIPNMKTGQRGLSEERFEVVERNELFAAQAVSLVLQDANFERPAFITPDAAPDYDAASITEKEFAYIAPDEVLQANFTTDTGETFTGYDNIGPSIVYPSSGHGANNDIRLGWISAISAVDRDSGVSPDERYDSFAITAALASSRFRIDLANGLYSIRIVAGDPDLARLKQTVFVFAPGIGVTQYWEEVDIPAGQWLDVTHTIEVTGARMDVFGVVAEADDVVWNFIEIIALEATGPDFDDGGKPYQII